MEFPQKLLYSELDLSTALLHVNEQKFYDVFKGESREDNARLIFF